MSTIEHEPSDQLLDLIFAALDIGIDTVRATNGGMHPFLMTPADGKPAYTRFGRNTCLNDSRILVVQANPCDYPR